MTHTPTRGPIPTMADRGFSSRSFARLVEVGRAGPHGATIARDIPRAFGSVAPHKRRHQGHAAGRFADGAHATTAAATENATADSSRLPPEPRSAWLADLTAAFTGGGRVQEDISEDGFSHEGRTGEGWWGAEGRNSGLDDRYGGVSSGGGGGGINNVPGLGMLAGLLRFGLDQEHDGSSSPFITQTPARSCRRRGLTSAVAGQTAEPPAVRLPPKASPAAACSSGGDGGVFDRCPPLSLSLSARVSLSLSPPRSTRNSRPPSGPGISGAGNNGRLNGGTRSSSTRGARGAEDKGAVVALGEGGDGDGDGVLVTADAPQDKVWSSKAEAAWGNVPVAAKRMCLGNVLYAMAARFPDVGYCQVSLLLEKWDYLAPSFPRSFGSVWDVLLYIT